jgi:large repetitive protein
MTDYRTMRSLNNRRSLTRVLRGILASVAVGGFMLLAPLTAGADSTGAAGTTTTTVAPTSSSTTTTMVPATTTTTTTTTTPPRVASASTPTATTTTVPTTTTTALSGRAHIATALDHLVLSPASVTFTLIGNQTYKAEGFDASNNDLGDVTSSTTFTISPDGGCAPPFTFIPDTCTAQTAGVHTVTGTDGTATGTATLTITPGPIDHLVLSPASVTINVGSHQLYTAEGFDQLGNDLGDVTSATTFTGSGPGDVTCIGNSCTPNVGSTPQTPDHLGVTGTDGPCTTVSCFDNNGPNGLVTGHASLFSIAAPPVAHDQSASTNYQTQIVINLLPHITVGTGSLQLDTTAIRVAPQHGTAYSAAASLVGPGGWAADGTIKYVPASGFSGVDSFGYSIGDSNGYQATATVTITVGPSPPTANNTLATTNYQTSINVPVNVDPGSDPLAANPIRIVQGPTHGTATVQPSAQVTAASPSGAGTIIYTPSAGFSGRDSLTYEGCSVDGLCGQATLDIVVGPPAAVAPQVAPPATTPVAPPPSLPNTGANVAKLVYVGLAALLLGLLLVGAATYRRNRWQQF